MSGTHFNMASFIPTDYLLALLYASFFGPESKGLDKRKPRNYLIVRGFFAEQSAQRAISLVKSEPLARRNSISAMSSVVNSGAGGILASQATEGR